MSALWGGVFIVGKVMLQNIGPFSVAFCRYAFASVCLLLISLKIEGKLPSLKRSQILPVILLGIIGIFLYSIFFFIGLQKITASRAAIIYALNPIFITLCSAFVFKEKLTTPKAIGTIASLLGAGIVIAKGNLLGLLDLLIGKVGWGEICLFASVFSWVIYTLLGKLVIKELSPLVATTYACLIGGAALFVPAWIEGFVQDFNSFPILVWLGVMYLGFLSSAIGFTWYYEALKAIGPVKTGVFINLVPVFGIFLAVLLLHEQFTPSLLLGTTLVLTGVSIVNL